MEIVAGLLGALLAVPLGLALWAAYVSRRIEKALPAQGAFVEVAGGRIHYREAGPAGAPPVVLIHGILSQMRVWDYGVAEGLAADHRVILVDRPGWGYSKLAGARPGIGMQAAMIAEALGKLGVEKALVVGHSMGGAVSLALAQAHPERVRALALIAPYTQAVAAPAPFRDLVMPGWARPLAAWTLALPLSIRKGPDKTREVFAPEAAPADFGTRGGGLMTVRPAAFQSGSFEMGMANAAIGPVVARYGAMSVPVAILYGRGDNLLDPAINGRRTAEAIPGAVLTVVEGGHMLPVTQAAATEAWIRTL
jgi:pimeloyl-ACP methyl ester carboxylesterase